MSVCERLRDRMPDVAHGKMEWSPAERGHIEDCVECRHEWWLVRAGTSLAADTSIGLDGVAVGVVARLRATSAEPEVQRLPWRGGVIGVLAIAASLFLVVSLSQSGTSRVSTIAVDSAVLVPELRGLDETQLLTVLQSMGPSAGDAAPGLVPHLEDLTDSELEQLLRSEGGE